jgi:hypothetical protein
MESASNMQTYVLSALTMNTHAVEVIVYQAVTNATVTVTVQTKAMRIRAACVVMEYVLVLKT